MGLVVRVVGFREFFLRVNTRFMSEALQTPSKPFNRDTLVRFGLEDSLDYP